MKKKDFALGTEQAQAVTKTPCIEGGCPQCTAFEPRDAVVGVGTRN